LEENAVFQMVKLSKLQFVLLVGFLFIFRILYGLSSEFWFEDELQIYLIGLKAFTTHSWPYYGPDIVYTNTQIPGALQGLLVAGGLFLFPFPEVPTLLLNILSFAALAFFGWYTSKRMKNIPSWLVWVWVMTLTWTMHYSTRVVNPSYVLVFSLPFFVCLLELLPIFERTILPRKLCYFVIGFCPFMIMQLHMSYVLLFPFIGLVFLLFILKPFRLKELLINGLVWLLGAIAGLLTLIPTWLHPDESMPGVGSNVIFNIDNYKNIIIVLTRYLSFASYEIPYIIGVNTQTRIDILKSNIWMAPFALFLLVFGFFLVVVFIYSFFKHKTDTTFNKVKYLTFLGYVLVFLSFFFSIKGPSSHTFYILLPLPVFYSFYCYDWLWSKFKWWKYLMYAAVVSCLFFYPGLGAYNLSHKSLYVDRQKVVKAIEQKDYRILGNRRADKWGYGY